jgi:acylphosphatase
MTQLEVICAHVLVSGRVQGVGYRATAWDMATRLGLSGWVRNLPDGRVEATLEGDRASVEQMLAWCRQGPKAAIVKDLSVTYEHPQSRSQFQILR